MRKFKKAYQIELTLLGPIFIGSGEKLNSKEYIFKSKGNKVYILDIKSMFKDIIKMGLGNKLENYLIDKGDKRDLLKWLESNKIKENVWKKWVKYETSAGNTFSDTKTKNNIELCIKNPYGKPYIPGTSLKGAIKNIIISDILKNDRKLRSEIQKKIEDTKSRGRKYLSYEEGKFIEKIDEEINIDDIIIRDSEPLDNESLVIAKKRDLKVGKDTNRKKGLNVVRECIKPGTKIRFEVIIGDEFRYSIKEIEDMMKRWFRHYSDVFISKFRYKSRGKVNEDSIIYLGGGSGFITKTLIYSIFDGKEAVRQTMNVIKNTSYFAYDKHKHSYDEERYGISPYMLKLTEINNEDFEFGMCKLSSVKEI